MSTDKIADMLNTFTETEKKDSVKQRKIEQAAIKLFLDKGFSNTSTSEIAKEAGVAEVTIFRNYKSKDNLLLSIILPFLKGSTSELAKEFGDSPDVNRGSLESFVRAIVYGRHEFIKSNKDIFFIAMKELIYRKEFLNEMMPYISQNIEGFIYQAIDDFKAKGQITDNIPTPEIVEMVASAILGSFAIRLVLDTQASQEAEIIHLENLISFIIKGIGR